jgi:PAS domain S-box-containing protein
VSETLSPLVRRLRYNNSSVGRRGARVSQLANHGANAGRVNILLVDDEPANLLALEAVLGPLDQNLVRANSGEEALRLVLEMDFAAILLDVRMPGLTGFEAAKLIRSRPRSRATPIIFLTAADGDPFTAEQAYSLGAVDYLTKPLVPTILRAKVAIFVELYQKGEALKAAERERADAAVRESEERLKLAVAIAQLGTFDLDLTTGAGVVNETGREVFGWEGTAATFAQLESHFHPDDRDEVIRLVRAALEPAGPGSFEAEHRIRRADGAERWIRVRGQAFFEGRDATRRAIRCIGAYLDVTDRRQAQEALRASEEEFRTTFERAGVGKVHADPATGRLVRVNPALCALIGYSAEELLGMTIRDITHPDEREPSEERFRALVAGRVQQYAVETRYVRKGGAVIWVRVTANVLRAPGGAPVRVSAIIEDITARKRAEEALVEEGRRKDEFLATLAHELRNPLAPISNALALMKLSPPDGAVAERARAMMERQLAHMVRLIDDLLDISRVSRGKVELRKARVSVAEVLEAALEVSRPPIEAARHRLEVQPPAEPLLLDADPVRIAQVVSNLLNNAAKYTPPGGDIILSARREGGEAVIRVTDTGAGLEAEMLPRVFEMFNQSSKTIDRAQGGLGIGLSLVKRLVEMHGGTVAADSAGAGRGSTFTVRLPLAE